MNWVLIEELGKILIAGLVGALIWRAIQRHPRLVALYSPVSVFHLGGTPQLTIHTHALIIRNGGAASARNVRVRHNVLPAFVVHPSVQFDRQPLPAGGEELIFPILASEEQITISYLYAPPLTSAQINSQITSDEGLASVSGLLPIASPITWVPRMVWIALIVMFGVSIYLRLR